MSETKVEYCPDHPFIPQPRECCPICYDSEKQGLLSINPAIKRHLELVKYFMAHAKLYDLNPDIEFRQALRYAKQAANEYEKYEKECLKDLL